MEYQELTMTEVEIETQKSQLAFLPIGAVEAHGPHLPLGTDNFMATGIARRIQAKTGGIILPAIPYGQVWGLEHFPGSLHISNESLIPFLCDIARGVFRQGFRVLVFVNGHIGNETALKLAARKMLEELPELKVLYFSYPGIRKEINEVCETKNLHPKYFHACEIETSMMLYVNETLVKMERAVKDENVFPIDLDFSPTRWEEFTEHAILGDATLATQEKGKIIIDALVERIEKVIVQVCRTEA